MLRNHNTQELTSTSPDISVVIQEIIDREGWGSGNEVTFWSDDDHNTTESSYKGTVNLQKAKKDFLNVEMLREYCLDLRDFGIEIEIKRDIREGECIYTNDILTPDERKKKEEYKGLVAIVTETTICPRCKAYFVPIKKKEQFCKGCR